MELCGSYQRGKIAYMIRAQYPESVQSLFKGRPIKAHGCAKLRCGGRQLRVVVGGRTEVNEILGKARRTKTADRALPRLCAPRKQIP